MRRLFPFILLSILSLNSFGQDTPVPPPQVRFPDNGIETSTIIRKYFFEGIDFSEKGQELVILTKEPQTQLAEDIGYRVYSDTSFLNQITSEFYRDIDTRKGEVAHFCGHDIYFYIKSGKNLKFFNKINSHCGISKLGCDDLDVLVENGRALSADSLKILDFVSFKPTELIDEDALYVSAISSDGIWQDYQPLFYNTCSKPKWLYDGKFQTTLQVDHETPINEYIDRFFEHVDSLEFRNINYALEHEDEERLHLFNFTSPNLTELRLNVFLDNDYYHYFEGYEIKPNDYPKRKIEMGDGFIIVIK
ncbi:MAG: hypothetical protein AB8B56_13590 [Crocinitomicaceae bacterium]